MTFLPTDRMMRAASVATGALMCAMLTPASLSAAEPAPFELAGPALDILVMRGDQSLPIAQVPSLSEGDRLSIELGTTAGNRVREMVAQVIQSQLRQVNIDVRIKAEPPRIFFEAMNRRNYTGLGMYAWVQRPELLFEQAYVAVGDSMSPRRVSPSAMTVDAARLTSRHDAPGFAVRSAAACASRTI